MTNLSPPPPINPNVNVIADRAKYGYALGTRALAAVQYRLAILAGAGALEPDESMRLQRVLVDVWNALYFGTTSAVRDEDTDEDTWDDADNTYSDGRSVTVRDRIESWEEADCSWTHNRFACGDGAVMDFPRGTICVISPPPRDPTKDLPSGPAPTNDPDDSSGEIGRLSPGRFWGEHVQANIERLEKYQ